MLYVNFHIPHKLTITFLYIFFLTRICIHLLRLFYVLKHSECLLKNWHIICIQEEASIWRTCVNANSVYAGTFYIYTRWHIIKVFVVLLALIVSKVIPKNVQTLYTITYKGSHIHVYCFLYSILCSVTHVKWHTRDVLESLSFSPHGVSNRHQVCLFTNRYHCTTDKYTYNNINAKILHLPYQCSIKKPNNRRNYTSQA